jgi:formylglycine-generating enzyme required for sulfatase activity
VARADLLRALQATQGASSAGAAGQAQVAQLAQGLGFYLRPESPLALPTPAHTSALPLAPASADASVPAPAQPARASLRIPFFGVVECLPLAEAQTEAHSATTKARALQAADFAASSSQVPPFQPLQRQARLATRLQAALQQQQSGKLLDFPRLVDSLARQHAPARWPRRRQAYPPARVMLLFDHSLSARVLWQDQEQVLASLAHWLGPRVLDCYRISGDPWQPASAWVNGQRKVWPNLPAPAMDTVVLLLTGPGPLLARWQQVAQFLAQNGAKVLWFEPFHGACYAQPGAVGEADPAAWNYLLTILSCARRIEPELLRALRLLDPQLAAQPQLEAQVWASPLFEVGYDVAVWRAEQHARYRERFVSLPHGLQQQVWRTLRIHHANRGRAIFVQEALAFAVYADSAAIDADMAAEIVAARAWLAGLLQCEEAHAGHAGFAAFAGQWFAFHAEDEKLLHAHEDEFAELYAIADAASLAQGGKAHNSGKLSAASIAQVKHLAGLPVARYHLCQGAGQWLLQRADTLPNSATPGMPYDLAWVTVDGARLIAHEQERVPLLSQAHLAQLAQGGSVRLQTPKLQLRLGQVAMPLPFERGRDEYGLYALWGLAGQVIRLRYIEPGQFWMGSPEVEHGRVDDEGPQHMVTISQGFWLADTVCSQALWQAVMGDSPSDFYAKKGGGPNHPVERVSWGDIQPFLQKLSAMLPADFMASLPTEAEWEYACRAGTCTPFWFGEDINTDQANFIGDNPYRGSKKGVYRKETVPVDSFGPNGWGLYQMHGNVWEWCGDKFQRYGSAAVLDPGLAQVLSPQGDQGSHPERAIRGGGWGSTARGVRSACRSRNWRDRRDGFLGFRLALRSRHGSPGA